MGRLLDRLTPQNSQGIPFIRLWDNVCTKIEGAFGSLTDQLALIAAAATTAHWSGVSDDNGHKPEDNATLGAAWGTNLTGRPTELTDGRVSAGLTSAGDLNRNITSTRANSSNILRYTGGALYSGDTNATYGADLASNVTNNNLDNVTDGAVYARIKGTELTSGQHKLGIAGSGSQLGDQRNLPPIAAANLRYRFTGTSSYSAAAGTPATATISVTAGSLILGSISVSYNAMSVNLSGTGGSSVTYYLYVSANAYSNGAHTLHATTTGTDIYSDDNYVYIDTVTVAYPAAGTSSGSGDGGGGGICVTTDTPILMAAGTEKAAGELKVGDVLRTRHEITLEWGEYPVAAISAVKDQPVFKAVIEGNVLRATAMHRVWLGEWVHVCALGAPDGTADVVRISVADAHTYVSNGILSHNLKPS